MGNNDGHPLKCVAHARHTGLINAQSKNTYGSQVTLSQGTSSGFDMVAGCLHARHTGLINAQSSSGYT